MAWTTPKSAVTNSLLTAVGAVRPPPTGHRFSNVYLATSMCLTEWIRQSTRNSVKSSTGISPAVTFDGAARAGVHSGEVERDTGNLRGAAVHAVTHIAALAQLG
jgi:hypothetical protein